MSQSKTHSPKLRALEAQEEKRLRPAAVARLERHLSSCDACQGVQRGLRMHAALTAELLHGTPSVDFTRMELVLRREAKALRARRQITRVLGATLAVAAAALLAWNSGRLQHQPPMAQQRPQHQPSKRPEAPPRHVVASVSALRGEGQVIATNGQARALDLETSIAEGESVVLGATSEAHVLLGDQTGFVLEAGSRITIETSTAHVLVLALAEGSVTSQVRHLDVGERYEVRALGYTVAVRGTHFRVAANGGKLNVQVEDGHVLVTDRAGKVVGDLLAPAMFDEAHGITPEAQAALPVPRLPVLLTDQWPALHLPVWPAVRAWTIDGSSFSANAQLAMRVPLGDVTLLAKLSDGRERSAVVAVSEGGLVMELPALRSLLHVNDEGPAAKTDPSALAAVVAQGTPALQRCYERALKQRPDVSGRFLLRINVDASGHVRSAAPRDNAQNVPADLLLCIREVAQRWVFPAGGRPLTFDAPLRLRSGY